VERAVVPMPRKPREAVALTEALLVVLALMQSRELPLSCQQV